MKHDQPYRYPCLFESSSDYQLISGFSAHLLMRLSSDSWGTAYRCFYYRWFSSLAVPPRVLLLPHWWFTIHLLPCYLVSVEINKVPWFVWRGFLHVLGKFIAISPHAVAYSVLSFGHGRKFDVQHILRPAFSQQNFRDLHQWLLVYW